MYKASDRESLLISIVDYMNNSSSFEGVLLIGSGAGGFADIYSDIDLMAGCYSADSVDEAAKELQTFFDALGACYVEPRKWTATALGYSVYFENGLSIDLSFMPTDEIPLKSPQYKVLLSKTDKFANTIRQGAERFEKQNEKYGVDNSIHYHFINELRYVEIALMRRQFVWADIALNNARQLLLAVETVAEGKKLHQFKAYNSLEQTFLDKLEGTYPCSREYQDIHKATESLLNLYLETIKKSDYLKFDEKLLCLLGRFE